uniref:transposase n=1 Tax=Microcoleus sp. CAWBG58 TaxID=2841651 RepID=UPI0025E44DFA
MTILEREAQILRVRAQGIHPALSEQLSQTLRLAVVSTVKTVIEGALREEVTAFLGQIEGEKPQRSGYYSRGLNTQYGSIKDLKVPKLRHRNGEREWQILERYQRNQGTMMDWLCCLYVMGLSLRDLQFALYFLLGRVLSVSAVNQITLQVQQKLAEKRQSLILETPSVILVDGVWVDIQYVKADEYKEDQSGHLRQCREVQERVVLAVMAIWADGRHELLHYEVAETESETSWKTLFKNLIARGFEPKALKLVSSDGSLGIPSAISTYFPNAQQQRCITHKVRGIERHLKYLDLPTLDEQQKRLEPTEAKKQRRSEIVSDAYQIFEALELSEAMVLLTSFKQKWQSLEPDAVRTFLKDSELTLTFYQFAPELHHHIRTTNHLERLFREFRTKSDEIGAFPNETSCLTVFCLVVERDHAKHD